MVNSGENSLSMYLICGISDGQYADEHSNDERNYDEFAQNSSNFSQILAKFYNSTAEITTDNFITA